MKSIFSKASLVAVVALVALSLILVGCGSAADDAGDVTTVKIGVGAPLTAGGAAPFGQGASRVTKMAAEEFNNSDRAKELGIKFEVVDGDDQGKDTIGVNVANNFIADADLVGVVGHINSAVSKSTVPVYNEARVVMVAPSSTEPTLSQMGYDNFFRTCTIDPVQGTAAADAVYKDLGLKNVYVVDNSTDYGSGLADYFSQQFEKNGGTIAGREKTANTDSDFMALVTKIIASGADGVFYGGLADTAALFAKQLRDSGFDGPYIGGDGMADGQFITLTGADVAENCYGTKIGLPLEDLEAGVDFKERYVAMYPNDEITSFDTYSYDAAVTIMSAVLDAAEEVGADKVTSAEGREAIIKAVAASNFDGVTGNVSFKENGDSNNTDVTFLVVKDGTWVRFVK